MSHFSNVAYAVSVDAEYYGRGYTAKRSANHRSRHVWRTRTPDAPVDESNDDCNNDPFHDEDGEPLYVAECETREMATALTATLNAAPALLEVAPALLQTLECLLRIAQARNVTYDDETEAETTNRNEWFADAHALIARAKGQTGNQL